MNFEDFNKKIAKIAKMKLPGEEIHLKMAPIERLLELKQKAKESQTAKKAGVMMLFYPSNHKETHFTLILRKTYKGVHSAQVGFPGGRYEITDASLQETALRETEEEIGVPQKNIQVLKKLTEIYIPPSNFFVQPFVGIAQNKPAFKIQVEEVEKLLEIPLSLFMQEDIKVIKTLSTSYAKNIQVPAFLLSNQLVWGATAMMLNEAREMLKELL